MHQAAAGDGARAPAFQRIADDLRRRINEGEFADDTTLPTQESLADRHHVSRPTVQRAIDLLRKDGLVDAPKKGRPPKVLHTAPAPDDPAPVDCLMRAFGEEEVTLDVVSVTMQSLVSTLKEPFQAVSRGSLTPASITVRALIPRRSAFEDLPRLIQQPQDRRPGDRLHEIGNSFARVLWADLNHLEETGQVRVSVRIKTTGQLPGHKFYILNSAEVLFGAYTVQPNEVPLDPGSVRRHAIYDVRGMETPLLHFHGTEYGGSTHDAAFIDQQRAWFETRWETIAVPWSG
ncbi:winged helix-turn-helix domain-containing protein [Streptomyces sp. CMB-StM0423]|uniref:winged helix-turn-helix domain-containing protein n=1 Tax=Streptomyces sp. CMB-StM0423 TaxID=2059884 RepID=UPI00131B5366|nr:winged helix-turn-helix domain-containing protein [Streptomyces sp. CMB-StM0423]